MIYNKIVPTGFVNAFQALVNSNNASISNVFLTQNDLSSTGISQVIFLAPNGGKWKATVNNSGTLGTASV